MTADRYYNIAQRYYKGDTNAENPLGFNCQKRYRLVKGIFARLYQAY